MTEKIINFKVEGLNDLEELYRELFELRKLVEKGFEGKMFFVSSRAYSTCRSFKLYEHIPVITTDSKDPIILNLEKRYSELFDKTFELEEQYDRLVRENEKLKEKLNKKPWWS